MGAPPLHESPVKCINIPEEPGELLTVFNSYHKTKGKMCERRLVMIIAPGLRAVNFPTPSWLSFRAGR